MHDSTQLRLTVYASLMAALTAAGAFIPIPVPFSPVPVTLQSLFIMIAGLILGPRWGLISISVYLLAGAGGLPVFSGATGGLAHFAGPTGGYLFGFLPAVFIIGLISEKAGQGKSFNHRIQMIFDILAMICGTALIYLFGVSWLVIVYAGKGMTLWQGLTVGMIPFLPGDLLKIIAAGAIARSLRPVLQLSKAKTAVAGSGR